MEKFTVSESVEIILDGQRILLEKGDQIMVEYVRGVKYNEVKLNTDADTSSFVKENINGLLEGNPDLRVGNVLDAFLNKYPHYLTEGDLAEQMSIDKIKNTLYYSIKTALEEAGLFPDPVRPGGRRSPKQRPAPIRAQKRIKKKISPTM